MATSDGKVTVKIDPAVLEAARDAVAWLNRHGDPHLGHMSIRRLVEEGIREQLQRHQEQQNGGAAFPPRDQELTPGRPLTTRREEV